VATIAAARLTDAGAVAAEHADDGDAERRLAEPVVTALREAGLFRALVPAVLGGLESGPQEFLDAVRKLATQDASAAWLVAVCGTGGMLAAYLEPAAAREVYGESAIVGGVFAPRGRAVPDGDELVVSGRWTFASGSAHADWLMVGCLVADGEDVVRTATGAPDIRLVLFPRDAFTIHDTWDVAGLRATGSNDIELDGARAPLARSASLISQSPATATPLYAFPPFGLLALSIAAVTLGIAEGAIADLLELAGAKTPTGSTRPLAARADTQARVARAQAALDAASALVAAAVRDAWEAARGGAGVSVDQRAGLRRAATHATETAARVTGDMYALGGGSAVYGSSPLQRRQRDVHVATQHMLVGQATWELAGRVALGLDTDAGQL
jgi:alkylation response protein AidB-like acyl-CoA dehydrogenase